MKIVIAGGAGLIGRHLAADLAAHGHEVLTVDRVAAPPGAGASAVADLGDAKGLEPLFRGADAVVNLARQRFPYTASGYDAASRTWYKPDVLGDAERFTVNIGITYSVLAACLATGVKRVVNGSSYAVYGLYYPSRPLAPEYAPIDEAHPRRPDDPYGLSKLAGEDLADGFAARGITQIASLRFPGVCGDDRRRFLEVQKLEIRGPGGLCTYVDARDAAIACRLAAEAEFRGHEAFNIGAPTTLATVPTRELLSRYYPELADIRGEPGGNWAGYSTEKARRMLGFSVRYPLEL